MAGFLCVKFYNMFETKKRLTFYLLVFLSFNIFAQNGKISGKIIDKKTGETLPGATVLVEGTSLGAAADFDGNFLISSVPAGTHNLICKFISYSDKKLTGIQVKAGEIAHVTIAMEEPKSDTLNEVVIVATVNKENNSALVLQQKNAMSVSDGISAESIRRTPDRSTSDVLKRVSGATIQDNKFAIIRGMNDRYNAAYINGAPLPSSESDRKAFSFDIFPSAMLDNLIILKTATPDLPGEFAGGVIMLNTKDIPDKNNYQFSLSGGYHTITTGQDFKTYKGGKYDWLGLDDGTRALKSVIPDSKTYSGFTKSNNQDTMVYFAKQMKYAWGNKNIRAKPNTNIQGSMSHVGKLFGGNAGSVFAVSYINNNTRTISDRRDFEEAGTENIIRFRNYTDTTFTNNILASALWNLAYKFNENHQISLKNIYSVNTEDRVTSRSGITDNSIPKSERSNVKWFTQNNIITSQLQGTHSMVKNKLTFKWIVGYNDIKRTIPCMRKMVYDKLSDDVNDSLPLFAAIQNDNLTTNSAGVMFFSTNQEKMKSIRYELAYDFKLKKTKHEVKIGGFHQIRDREFEARVFGFTKYKSNQPWKFNISLLGMNEEQIFAVQNMGLNTDINKNGFKLSEATTPLDAYSAGATLHAGFAMLDSRFSDKIRAIYGARLESYNQRLTTKIPSSTSSGFEEVKIDTTVIDILPSVNLVYSITDKMNIRAAYYRTVTRPEFRELASFNFYDFILDYLFSGNPALKRGLINNYDLRYEIYPGAGQIFSVSGFYKNITDAVEMVANTSSQIRSATFTNSKKVTNIGTELEYRIKLGTVLKKDSAKFLANSTLYTNFAYIQSKVDVSNVVGSENRPLQGQSPFILNAGYTYMDNEKGWAASLAYNIIGRRIFIVGSVDEPSFWENSRHVIDLQLAKTFKKHYQIKFNVRDLLAQRQIFYQDLNKNGKLDKGSEKENQKLIHSDKYDNIMINNKMGATYSLTFSINF